MGINTVDVKLLWARAAGRCSHPDCGIDLTVELEASGSIVIGEMAHAIAHSEVGPRGARCPGSNAYDNLILLCPTHHTIVDKAPLDFPVEALLKWKADHERGVANALASQVPPVLWHVPVGLTGLFVGRAEELALLEERANEGLVAITGPGGVGKSALAAHWAQAQRERLDVVWWMSADSEVDVGAGLEQLGLALQIPMASGHQELLQWLSSHSSWALIMDNAAGPALLGDLRGVLEHGVVVMTSRNPNWRPHANPVELKPLSGHASAELLESRAGSLTEDVTDLAADLGGLPLALAQAGSFIQATGTSVTRYRELLASRFRELMELGTVEEHPAGVWATWQEAMSAALDENALVEPLVRTLAFLASDPIPLAAFRDFGHNHEHTGLPSLDELMSDPLKLSGAVATARRFALVEASADLVSMHGVFQRIARDSLDEERSTEFIMAACSVIYHALPPDATGDEALPSSLILLSHGVSALVHALEARIAHPLVVRLAIEIGRLLVHLWSLQLAVAFLRMGMAVSKALDEPEPRATLILNAVYADALIKLGRYDDAVPMADRALALAREQEDTHEEAVALARRGALASDMGDLELAGNLLEAALARDADLHGEESPLYAAHLNNLGIVRERQMRMLESYELQKRAFDISVSLGNYGREAAVQLGNLAAAASGLGRTREAVQLASDALDRILELFSSPHYDIAMTRMKLGMAQMDHGRPELAGRIFIEARSELIDVLGANHPDVASMTHRLGLAYKRAGNRKAAIREYEDALAMRIGLLGSDHPDVAETHNNLAVLYEDRRDSRNALEHYSRAAEIYEKQRGGNRDLLRHIQTRVKVLRAALGQ